MDGLDTKERDVAVHYFEVFDLLAGKWFLDARNILEGHSKAAKVESKWTWLFENLMDY